MNNFTYLFAAKRLNHNGARKMLTDKTNVIRLINLMILPVSLMCFVIGSVFSDEILLLIAVCLAWIYLLIKNFKRSKVTILAFIFSFFAFLLGTAVISQFDRSVALKVSGHETIVHTYCCLYVALFTFNIGTILADRTWFKINSYDMKNTINDIGIQRASKYVFYLAAVVSLLLAGEKCAYTLLTGSYTSSYISFISVFPSIFSKIDGMRSFAFFIFLATLPNPRKAKMVFIIEFMISFLMMIYGQRTGIVLTLLIIFIYCILYENIESKPYSIIKRRNYFWAIILTPFLLVFFDFNMAYRDGRQYEFVGIFQSVEHILASLGGSVNVIGYAYNRAEYLPTGKLYSLGGIIDFFTKNFITRWFGVEIYTQNSVQHALYGNELSHALTYSVNPTSYLAGYGMGSCYIAETYHDFGYFGISLFSIIYGIILTKANKLRKGNCVSNTIIIISLYSIIVAPRNSADSFLSSFFNFSFLITLAIIWVISKLLIRAKKNPEVIKNC